MIRKQYFQAKVDQLDLKQSRNWWNEIRSFTGEKHDYDPLKNLVDNVAHGDQEEFAEFVNSFFASISSDLPPLEAPESHSERPIPTKYVLTSTAVEKALKSVKTHKAPGPDQIPNWILKDYASTLAVPICSIFNASVAQATLPSIWKAADVIAIPKTTPPASVENDLRPISLTAVLVKVLEGFVFKWLWEQYQPQLDPLQFGNVPGSSTTCALIDLLHNWYSATDQAKNMVRVIFLDYSKAFDRINHVTLIDKLKSLHVDQVIVNWVTEFLRHRMQRVKIGTCKSQWTAINGGVPQGTKLGPLLFIMMIGDLQPSLPTVKYVDDTTMYEVVTSSDESKMQESVQEVIDWSSHNDMRINPNKTKEMVISFSKRTCMPLISSINIDDNNIDRVKQMKLLGLNISDDLRWETHVNAVYTKAAQRLYLLVQLRRAGLNQLDLCKYYFACIRSILDYACQVYHSSLTKEQSNLLESIQRRALRIIIPGKSLCEGMEQVDIQT